MPTSYIIKTSSAAPVEIPDLQLWVDRHAPVSISEVQHAGSVSLSVLVAIGAITISKKVTPVRVRKTASVEEVLIVPHQEPSPKGQHNPPEPPQRPAHVPPARRPARAEGKPLEKAEELSGKKTSKRDSHKAKDETVLKECA